MTPLSAYFFKPRRFKSPLDLAEAERLKPPQPLPGYGAPLEGLPGHIYLQARRITMAMSRRSEFMRWIPRVNSFDDLPDVHLRSSGLLPEQVPSAIPCAHRGP